MKKFMLGEKVGMTQLVSAEGVVVPVTVVKVTKNTVLQVQALEKKSVVVMGYGVVRPGKLNKPRQGFFSKIGVEPNKVLRSFQTNLDTALEVKQELGVEQFSDEELVSIRGRSIGKGFAGTIKRHNFSRGPRSHGSKNYRAPGSIGAGTTPGRVLKGKRMAGHMGDRNVTIRNLKIVKIDQEQGLIFVKGAVPGKAKSILEIYN